MRKTKFTLKATGLDPNSNKTGIIMEILSTDRERCFGPKPTDLSKAPNWKLKIGFSTVNVSVAYAKAEKRRLERAKTAEALSRPPPPPPPQTTPQKTSTDVTTTATTEPTVTDRMEEDELDTRLLDVDDDVLFEMVKTPESKTDDKKNEDKDEDIEEIDCT